jgi:predicted TIM-barrel fold metal-dependent hydrolase
MKKFLFLIFSILMMSGLVVAVDVAYVVNSVSTNSDFTDTMDELDLTYDIIFSSDVPNTNFDDYGMILLNNQDFPNPEEIPINEFPALMINGRNMEDWGWVDPISKVKQSILFIMKS